MKTLLIIPFFLIICGYSFAQNFEWAKQFGGSSGNGTGISLKEDGLGNIYVTGSFQGTVDFDPGINTNNLTSLGSADIFIEKLDFNGNLVWVKQIGGVADDQSKSIVIDVIGNIYTVGYFSDTVDFDPGIGIFNLIGQPGNNSLFVLKLTSQGNFIWAKQISGDQSVLPTCIAIDQQTNVYLTGTFSGTADFDPNGTSHNLTSVATNDIFIEKLDSAGNFIWGNNIGSTSDNCGYSITATNSGYIYVTGYFKGVVDFDPSINTNIVTTNGAADVFVGKFDSSGNLIWAKNIGGPDDEVSYSIAIDGQEYIYISGVFRDAVDFDPGSNTYTLTAPLAFPDVFIEKLDSSGNFLWAKQIGGNSTLKRGYTKVDSIGNVYTTGYFNGIVDFNPGSNTFFLTAFLNSDDIFLQKLDSSGAFLWVKQIGGGSFDRAEDICIDNNGNLFITGYFQDLVDFDPDTSSSAVFNLNGFGGGSDIFVQKMNQDTLSLSTEKIHSYAAVVSVYPNPADQETLLKWNYNIKTGRLTIYNTLGQQVFKDDINSQDHINISLHNFINGQYFYKITDLAGNSSYSGKFIVEK